MPNKTIEQFHRDAATFGRSVSAMDEEVWRTTENGHRIKIESTTGQIKAGLGGVLRNKILPKKGGGSGTAKSRVPEKSDPTGTHYGMKAGSYNRAIRNAGSEKAGRKAFLSALKTMPQDMTVTLTVGGQNAEVKRDRTGAYTVRTFGLTGKVRKMTAEQIAAGSSMKPFERPMFSEDRKGNP